MKKFLTFSFIVVCFSNLMSQSFNGIIEFKMITQKDTTNNVYSVKGQKVRLDQYNKKTNVIDGSYLFDLAAKEINFLNPKRKLWGVQKSETAQVVRGECIVLKGSLTKTIAGIKCTDYIVKNAVENTVITYWIANGNYNFFAPMVKLRSGKDKQSVYYAQIKGLPDGSMPLLSEEKQLTDGKLLTRLQVTKINTAVPDDAVLTVPSDYTKFNQ
jgi:hypothetical protein